MAEVKAKYQRIRVGGHSFVLVPESDFKMLTKVKKLGLQTKDLKGSDAPASPYAERIKAIRKEFGLSEDQFATKAGITQPQVSRLEGGQKPVAKTIKKLELAFSKIRGGR